MEKNSANWSGDYVKNNMFYSSKLINKNGRCSVNFIFNGIGDKENAQLKTVSEFRISWFVT
jgi:hypothetical protein